MPVAKKDLQRVSRCARDVDDARLRLLQAIMDAHASGETYRDIAVAAGFSHQRVWQIVKERERRPKQ